MVARLNQLDKPNMNPTYESTHGSTSVLPPRKRRQMFTENSHQNSLGGDLGLSSKDPPVPTLLSYPQAPGVQVKATYLLNICPIIAFLTKAKTMNIYKNAQNRVDYPCRFLQIFHGC